jgi:hypothetical protein
MATTRKHRPSHLNHQRDLTEEQRWIAALDRYERERAPHWTIEPDSDHRCCWQAVRNGAVVAQGFGSAAAASNWIDNGQEF